MSGYRKRYDRTDEATTQLIQQMHDYEFLSFAKIGKRLGIPDRTVQDAYNRVSKHRGNSLYRALVEDYRSVRNPTKRAAALAWLEANKEQLFKTEGTYFSERQLRDKTRHETLEANDLRAILTTSQLIKS